MIKKSPPQKKSEIKRSLENQIYVYFETKKLNFGQKKNPKASLN